MPALSRDRLLTLLLAALAAGLAVALGLEWTVLKRAREAAVQAPPVRATGMVEPTAQAQPDFALPALEAYPEMVQRPLFMENRRPGVDPGDAPPPPPPPTPMNFKLMGIVHTPEGKTALLTDAKGKYQRKRAGDTLEGWVLVEIAKDRATLQQGETREQITLLKKRPKSAPNMPQPGQPVPPPRPVQPGQPPQPVPIPQPTPVGGGGEEVDDGADADADASGGEDGAEDPYNQ